MLETQVGVKNVGQLLTAESMCNGVAPLMSHLPTMGDMKCLILATDVIPLVLDRPFACFCLQPSTMTWILKLQMF